MSSNTYTLKIAIDDSKIREIEKRLMNIVGGGTVGSGVGGKMASASKGGDFAKNIAKLGVIAIGVASIVGLVQKITGMMITSSPMLQQMLKLLNFGIMLIFRPIGDFIGFFLRPLMVYFIRSIALPWYRLMRPVLQKAGQWLGNKLVTQLTEADDVSGIPVWEPGFNNEEAMKNLESAILSWGAIFDLISPGQFDMTKKGIQDLKDFSTSITNWVDTFKMPTIGGMAQELKDWVTEQGDKLPSFWTYMKSTIRSWISDGSKLLPTIDLTFVKTWIEGIKLPTMEDVTALITSVKNSITGIIEAIKQFFVDIAATIGIDISGILTDTPAPPPPSAPIVTDNGQTLPGDGFPWLTETPSSEMSNTIRGHGR